MRNLLTLDHMLTRAIAEQPKIFRGFMSVTTWFGAPELLLPICLVVGAWQLSFGNRWLGLALWLAIGASFGGLGLSFMLRRSRPESPYADHLPFKSYSFPSVHALGTTVLSSLALFFLKDVLPFAQWWLVASVLLVFVVLIGFSRVYLGMHYVLDVLAGWAFGAVAAVIIIEIVQYAARLS